MKFMRWMPAVLLVGLIAHATPAMAAQTFIWWEGEDPVETNIAEPVNMRTPGNRNAEQQAKLSGGRWLTVGKTTDGGPAIIRYVVDVPVASTYDFYYYRKIRLYLSYAAAFSTMLTSFSGKSVVAMSGLSWAGILSGQF